MTPALLRQTAARYHFAVQTVLAEWEPACGCPRPGSQAECEACPGLALFEQRIRDVIAQQQPNRSFTLRLQQSHHEPCIHSLPEP